MSLDMDTTDTNVSTVDLKQSETHFKLVRFIIVSAMKLNMNDISLATAATIYHKFYHNLTINDFDPYLIATASIYLACKIEEERIKLRDIINVCYRTLHTDLEPLDLNEKYRLIRESVTQTELLIARKLAFKLEFDHPHKYLLQFLDSLRDWIPLKSDSPIFEVSRHMLRDMLHFDLLSKHRPQEIAISIIYFLLICYGIRVPYSDQAQKQWYKALDEKTSQESIEAIVEEIVKLYDVEETLSN